MHTIDDIKDDIVKLGVKKGDVLFLRVSYKAIGKIEGGPKVFLDALLSIIGLEGTILMTAFPPKHITQLRWLYRYYVASKENFPKPFTGVMPVMALTYPEAKLSEKLEFPFVVIGKHAEYLTKNHTHDKSGYWLLREVIQRFNCKCLRIGGRPLFGSTHVALEDVFKSQNAYMSKLRKGIFVKENGKTRWYDEPNITFCGKAFSRFTDRITNAAKLSEGQIGNGYAIITNMKKSYEEEMCIYSEDIHNLLCDDPDCLLCRTSYSFSDSTNGKYLGGQIKKLFSKNYKKAMLNIESVLLKIIFEKKSEK